MMAQKASPLLQLVVMFKMLTLLYPSVTLLHQTCRAFVPHRAMVSSYQPLCDVISEIYKYVVQRRYISVTRGLWITVQLDCSQGIFLKDLNNSFSTIIELVTKASIYNQTSVKTSRLDSNFPAEINTLLRTSLITNFLLCFPPGPALCWGRKSADRYWIPECVAEHRGLGVMHQLVVELGGD